MSAYLLQAAVDYLRAGFTRAQVATVKPYGGEFSSAESVQVSFACPAIFVTVLGWEPQLESKRLSGRNVRATHMAAFVVYKHAKRDKRLAGAMALADTAAALLMRWAPPDGDVPVQVAPLMEEPTCENLYGRAIDSKSMALWHMRWEQDIKPLVTPEQQYDLLSIEIIDTTQQGQVQQAAPGGAALTVTEQVDFAPLPPA